MNNLPADKNRRVLVIDDNQAIHDDFRKILSPANAAAAAFDATETALFGQPTDAVQQTRFEIDSAYQGQEGALLVKQALAARQPYALAFVDVRMPPGWDGVETTQKLWEIDPHLQIVLCTAYADYSWGEMFANLGHRDGLLILKKPFDAVEAFQLAHALTEKWWLGRQARRKLDELEDMVAERTRELRENNDTLQMQARVIESMSEAVIVADEHGQIVITNPACASMFGYERGELIGQHDSVLRDLDEAEARRVVAEMMAFVQRASGWSGEINRRKKDGTSFIVQAQINVFEMAGQRHFFTVQEDITERKQAELALQESKRFLQSTLDALSAHIAILDEHGTIIEVNRAWKQFARANQFHGERCGVGDNYFTVCGGAVGDFAGEAPPSAKGIRAVMTSVSDEFQLEYPCHGPHEQRWFTLRATRFDGAGAVRVVVAHENITARKQAEQQLQESERRFGDMLRHVELVSMMLDRDGRVSYCNDYLLRLTGWQREEVLGRDWFGLFLPPDRLAELRVLHTELLANQPRAWHYESEIVTRAGERRLIRWNNSILRSTRGEVVGTASMGEDITERKRLETQLFQSQKMETVGKLAGGIAHEFNSIMTAILGQSELLLGDLPPGSPLVHNAKEIRKAADRAATLTRQLLAYGRKQILQPEILNLNVVLSNMAEMIRHLAGGNTDMRIVSSANLKSVKADVGQIEQVILNIVMNAADAMPNGGKLTLETSNATLDEHYVSRFTDLQAGEYVLLAITDSGAGMSEEVKARLFEPFFTTKGVGRGTGLGLATCYGITKQSAGHIAVYSELGRGSTFKIYLPQAEPLSKSALPPPESSPLPRGTETILLVEDDPALREMASALLRRLGYTVHTAGNGVEALTLAHQASTGHVDLLFTDIVMPHMSGKELADRIRALFSETKILFASAYTAGAIVHQGTLNPGVELLQKPFTPSALAHKVRAILNPNQPA